MKRYEIQTQRASAAHMMDRESVQLEGMTLYFPPKSGYEPGKIRRGITLLYSTTKEYVPCYYGGACSFPFFQDDFVLEEADQGILRLKESIADELSPAGAQLAAV